MKSSPLLQLFPQLRCRVSVHCSHTQYFAGGNAALMGLHLAEAEHAAVSLVASVGPRLQKLLPASLHVNGQSLASQVPSLMFCSDPKDEVHVILEYSKNESVCKLFMPLTSSGDR